MGIPAYFSYIVRNHPEIIKKYSKETMKIDNLFMDCNSIIYDVIRNLEKENNTNDNAIDINLIIEGVINKIEDYIHTISPNNIAMISFDGVAPFAKLEQQRTRRYKSVFQQKIMENIDNTYVKKGKFNTTAITPGTIFMDNLNKQVKTHFSTNKTSKRIQHNPKLNIIVSTSEEFGEGEHKIFEYIRLNNIDIKDDINVVYGLDADLIMLSINHLPLCPYIYLFRETPEFIKSIDNSLEPNETYLLNIPELTNITTSYMNNGKRKDKSRIYDYIFICFFLGNDFLPHHVSINIRTFGINTMLDAYKTVIGGTAEILTDGKKIYWKNVRKLVKFLACKEEELFKNETKLRDKREKLVYLGDTPEQLYTKFEAIPSYERDIEKKINPFKSHWQRRYYQELFKLDNPECINEDFCKNLSQNYLEGLEWTLKYYTTGCSDWRWCYKYMYPPLLEDLIRYIPFFEDNQFIVDKLPNPVLPLVQLCYVLPKECLHLLPEDLYKVILDKYEHLYPEDCEIIWAYCKYFWESHVKFPEINIELLEEIVRDFLQ